VGDSDSQVAGVCHVEVVLWYVVLCGNTGPC
jgi:hypothetical protein